MNEEEKKAVDKAIYELEDSYELHQREWAKKCLNTIKHGFTKLQKENEELKKDSYNLINKIENKIDRFDYEFEKAKRQNDKDKSDYYWDLIINFKKLLESEE